MSVHFEATNIRISTCSRRAIGSTTVYVDLGPAELEGNIRSDDGSHGTVSVPLDADERAFLKEIIESASKRALSLVVEVTGR